MLRGRVTPCGIVIAASCVRFSSRPGARGSRVRTLRPTPRLATSGALSPPQRKDLRGLALACDQSRDAAGPRVSPATGCEMPAPAGQTDKATGAARGPPTSWEGRPVLSRESVRGGQVARLLG